MPGDVTVEYAKVATHDHEHDHGSAITTAQGGAGGSGDEEDEELHSGIVHAIRNDNPCPISKPPTKYRDALYGALFIVHFLGIMLVTLIEKKSMRHAVLNYGRAGSWASVAMSLTLLSTVCGGVIFALLKIPEARMFMISHGLLASLLLKICMGNILLLMRSSFSFLGVFLLLSAILDSGRLKPARTALGFTSTLMQLSIDISAVYGIALAVSCVAIVAAQTCILLWWSSFYIGVLSTVSPASAALVSIVMMFSLYWTAQFFHHLVGFVVGGCTLFYFAKSDDEPLDKSARVVLYLKCGLSTSFGSLCKAALLVMPAQLLLHCQAWTARTLSANGLVLRLLGCFRPLAIPLVDWAKKYNKLIISSLAVYGRTLYSTADDQLTFYPGTLRTSQEEYSSYSLGCISTCVAGAISMVFGLLAESKSLYSWPLFFFLCFYLTYFGVSISLHIYSCAIDAFIIAAAINPDKFAKENQLVLLRFMRTGDPDLQA